MVYGEFNYNYRAKLGKKKENKIYSKIIYT